MIRICPKCGALLLDDTESCSFCDAEAFDKSESRQPVAAAVSVGDARRSLDDPEPDWRREVSQRLERYRARRGLAAADRHAQPDDSQSGLPFDEPLADEYRYQAPLSETDATEPLESQSREASESAGSRSGETDRRSRGAQRTSGVEDLEIRIQPELDFSSAAAAHPQTALVPVASLAERQWAGAIDAIFLGFTCAGFLGLFRSLGGQIMPAKIDAVVCLFAAYLFYGFYVSLFTTLAGATPGMQIRGLTIVRLDGSLPDTRQLLWRSFGYLLSAATLTLGYLWALWDEDRFTWQDRISQTYVTAAAPLADFNSLDAHARSH